MPFRLREDARTWFKPLREQRGGFAMDFDSYYFCFIAGIATKQKKEIPQADTAELVDHFPDKYRDRARHMVSLFLARELEILGVSISEKKTVHAQISKLIQPDSTSHLSADGMHEFNRYADGGFEAVATWFEDRPRRLETFLRGFKLKLDETLAKEGGG